MPSFLSKESNAKFCFFCFSRSALASGKAWIKHSKIREILKTASNLMEEIRISQVCTRAYKMRQGSGGGGGGG